jgi:hypothetical protein
VLGLDSNTLLFNKIAFQFERRDCLRQSTREVQMCEENILKTDDDLVLVHLMANDSAANSSLERSNLGAGGDEDEALRRARTGLGGDLLQIEYKTGPEGAATGPEVVREFVAPVRYPKEPAGSAYEAKLALHVANWRRQMGANGEGA